MSEGIAVAIIIAVVGPTVVAIVQRRDFKSRIGTPNGQGDLTQMVERIDNQVKEIKRRVEVVGGKVDTVDQRTADLVNSQAKQDGRIAKLEREHRLKLRRGLRYWW